MYEIVPRVFFGPAGVTYKPEIIKFTHIINCDSTSRSTNIWAREGRHFLFLESSDDVDFPILAQHFDRLLAFLTDALSDPLSRVYIHCFMGLNRSAALAVAYACHVSGRSARQQIAIVRAESGRPILSNYGFVEQLTSRWPTTTSAGTSLSSCLPSAT